VRWGESRGEVSLPHSWRTTSDAIAAWIARIIGAAELVLLKSAPLPESTTLADAAQAGLVDPVFPELARSLPHVSWVHARSPRPEIQPWLQFTH
jgi:aspartokinase-like uncharacterized kinase